MPEHPDTQLYELAAALGQTLTSRNLKLVTAESCTGGWISEVVTQVPGSSGWFDRGFVTYSNKAKQEMLGVKPTTLKTYGAVSENTALEMAEGALKYSHADISLSVTGIAGPDGGTADKPVGSVYIGYGFNGEYKADSHHFAGDRHTVRAEAVTCAINTLINILKSEG